MRIEVGTVRTATRLALGAAVLACGVVAVFHSSKLVISPLSSGVILHFAACYGLTLLGFAAYPHSRRTDLVRSLIIAAALFEIAEAFLGRGMNISQFLADVAGGYAVLVPSFLERFRSLTRADLHEPFSTVYPNDKRRRRARKAKAGNQHGHAHI